MTLREGSWGCAAPLCLGGVRTSLGADRLAASGPHDHLRWRVHDTHVLGVPMRRCPTRPTRSGTRPHHSLCRGCVCVASVTRLQRALERFIFSDTAVTCHDRLSF